MKKIYYVPEIEWIRFRESDVIVTSPQIGEGDDTWSFKGGEEENGTF